MLLKKTQKTFHNIFSPKRALFAVFLAVLVMGFSVNVSFAKLSALAPGTPLTQEWKDAAQKIENLKNATTMPTSPFAYELYLKSIGGYSNDEAFKTASQYKGLLKPVAPGDKERLKEYETGNPSSTNIYESKVYNTANAPMEKILEVAEWGVLTAVIGVLSIIASFLKEFVSYAAELLDLTLNPSLYNFTSNRMIVQGWTMVRDVCNLFFLLILLFIAMCTILKIEKYHAKKTLLTLIIMALLINFSKPIAIFIFDGSQLLMNEFLKQMGGTQGTGQTTSTVVAKASQIAGSVYKTLPPNSGETAIAVQYLFGVVFLFMLMVAYLVTALMLLVRIVVIMMLIIVSPFAFFAAVIPDFSKMSSQWWSSLFEYSYYGPAAAFFLLLATNLDSALPPLQNISGTDGRIDVTVNNILQYLLVLIFLYASIFMAKKFGGGAGAAIVGNANRFMKWGAGMTKGGGAWGSVARGTGVADVYKGVKGGIAKQPGWRMLTKEGREAKSKERQERWQERVAPFSIATAKKKAKERENDSEQDILRDAAKGDAAAMLVASQRGYSKDNNGNDLWTNTNIIKSLQNNDIRKAAYGNLRDKGKTHHVLDAEIERQGIATNAVAVRKLYDDELGGLSANNLGKQDLEAIAGNLLATNPATGDQWVIDKIKQLHTADPRLVTNMLSSGNSKNIQFIRDQRTMGNIP